MDHVDLLRAAYAETARPSFSYRRPGGAARSTACPLEWVDEVFRIDGRYVLVEHIPATVCAQCGEQTFSRETAEAVRCKVHDATAPVRAERLEVFAY